MLSLVLLLVCLQASPQEAVTLTATATRAGSLYHESSVLATGRWAKIRVLTYWIVSVTMYRLKKKGYPSVRWEEIRRIAGAQVMVTTRMETVKGEAIEIRQATEEEQELAKIYNLLDITLHPMGIKSL